MLSKDIEESKDLAGERKLAEDWKDLSGQYKFPGPGDLGMSVRRAVWFSLSLPSLLGWSKEFSFSFDHR